LTKYIYLHFAYYEHMSNVKKIFQWIYTSRIVR